MDFYTFLRGLHNLNRWIIALLLLWVLVRALMGLRFRRPWESSDRKAATALTAALDLQLLIGAVLYFISPSTSAVFSAFAEAMRNTPFFVIEHPFYMLLALVLAHVGSVRARKAPSGPQAHRTALIFFGLTLLLILLGMPWSRSWIPWA